ncbi:glutathione S-transferase theta-1 [Halictus rubicundus]|uniref:glutathione S-transferase theta-1 n=1 Tax=Halictus rubicundus TaxID=77578 RepID=UPI004036739F
MTLKLYYDLLSQPSRAVYIFLKANNIPFEKKITNLGKMEHLSSEYQKINPFQKVPSIQHNDVSIIESVAILRYLCKEFTVADHWYPKDSKAQAKVDEYLEWQHLNTRYHCALYFQKKYLMPIMKAQPTPAEVIAKYEKRMINCLDVLENIWLKDKPFLTGSEVTIADLLGACEVEQVRIAGYDPRNGRPCLATWLAKVEQMTNPYYQEAHVFIGLLANKAKEDKIKSKI